MVAECSNMMQNLDQVWMHNNFSIYVHNQGKRAWENKIDPIISQRHNTYGDPSTIKKYGVQSMKCKISKFGISTIKKVLIVIESKQNYYLCHVRYYVI